MKKLGATAHILNHCKMLTQSGRRWILSNCCSPAFYFISFFFLFLKSTGADGMVYWVKHFAGMAVFLYESDSSCPGRSVLPIQIPANVLGRQQMMLIDEGSCHLGRRSH